MLSPNFIILDAIVTDKNIFCEISKYFLGHILFKLDLFCPQWSKNHLRNTYYGWKGLEDEIELFV